MGATTNWEKYIIKIPISQCSLLRFIIIRCISRLNGKTQKHPIIIDEIHDFDLVKALNNGELAIEVKSSSNVNYRQLKGLRAFKEEHNHKRSIVISLDSLPRKTEDNIEILPWRNFLEQLWQSEFV